YDAIVSKDPTATTLNWALVPGAMRFEDIHTPLDLSGLENGGGHFAGVCAPNASGLGPDSAPAQGTPSGRGTFFDFGGVDVGTNPQASVIADFDGDGVIDLAVAARDSG